MIRKEGRPQYSPEQKRVKRLERRTIRQYHELIDLKFSRGLIDKEQAKLARHEAALDKMDAPFYDSMIQRLRTLTQSQIDIPQRSKPEKLFSRIHSGRIVYISAEGKARTKKRISPPVDE